MAEKPQKNSPEKLGVQKTRNYLIVQKIPQEVTVKTEK